MKIVLVGPVYPYKGGISHYTGLMCRSLRKEHEVLMLSFKMQYPKILFRKEQRDYENDTFAVKDTHYLLNTANPISCLKTARWINEQHADVVVFQWWHPYFAPCYYIIQKHLKRVKTIYLCHNVLPHERFPFCIQLSKMVLKNGDAFIVHSEQDADDLHSVVPAPCYRKTVHPTYNAFKFLNMTKEDARKKLGIGRDEKILLFFGFIREYKGLRHLIAAMPEVVRRQSNCKLYVVGDFGEAKNEYLKMINETGIAEQIVVHDEYVPDREIEPFFAACDLVVLPYESATQSGIVQIAYGFDKPVIATEVGGLPEVVLDGKTGYIVPPRNPKALSDAIVRFFEQENAYQFEENVRGEAGKYSWDRMNEIVASLFEEINRDEK